MTFDFDLVRRIVKKRGRKSEKDLTVIRNYKKYIEEHNIEDTIINEKKTVKKRGRKPKGGNISITQTNMIMNGPTFSMEQKQVKRPNVIIHLKCNVKINQEDNSNKKCNSEVQNFVPYNTTDNNFTSSTLTSSTLHQNVYAQDTQYIFDKISNNDNVNDNVNICETPNSQSIITNINKKLNDLQKMLNIDSNHNKKSNCFWCSCGFDNLPIFIPKSVLNDTYDVYGCFCTPECAAAFLFDEHIDPYIIWERYALLNTIYSCIYNYTDNIKPAPSPYYVLDKYYGNLSIDEFRNLNRINNVLLVVDKPLIRVMPEIYSTEQQSIHNIYKENTSKTDSTGYKLYRKKEHYTNKKNAGDIKNFIRKV